MNPMLPLNQKTHIADATLRNLINGLELIALPKHQRLHFETCVDCQKRMELMAADDWWWSACRSAIGEADADRNYAAACGLESEVPTGRDNKNHLGFADRSATEIRQLKQYEIESLIGSGGMGVVYKARDTKLNRTVAIKMLLPHLANQPGVRKQFLREARSAASISHEHVIKIFEVESNARHPFLVMSWVPGETLEAVVAREGVFSQLQVVCYASQIASALSAAHRLGIVHRDIKPANILIDIDQQKVFVTDFGLAKTVDEASLTRTGLTAGTPHYMSPEQCKGKLFSSKSDLFSLGCVMYFLATGLTPFSGRHPLAVMNQICNQPAEDIRGVAPEIDTTLAAVIHRLLEIDPADRFASAAELAGVLEAMRVHLENPDANPMPKIRAPKSWRRGFLRKPSLIEGAIVLTGIACGVTKLLLTLSL